MIDEQNTSEALRQRRKDKIMQTREDRLAKILSMASGRTIDPKEVHFDRTPSPTVSEFAAAGVGPLPKTNDEQLITNSSTSSIMTQPKHSPRKIVSATQVRHTIIILISSLFFVGWYLFIYSSKDTNGPPGQLIGPSVLPWHVMLTTFLGVESIEYLSGRLDPLNGISDFILYIFVIVLLTNVLH